MWKWRRVFVITFVSGDNYITCYTLVMLHMLICCQNNYKLELNSNCLEVLFPALYLLLRDLKQEKIQVKLSELQVET
jgi:hypothetical protein